MRYEVACTADTIDDFKGEDSLLVVSHEHPTNQRKVDVT